MQLRITTSLLLCMLCTGACANEKRVSDRDWRTFSNTYSHVLSVLLPKRAVSTDGSEMLSRDKISVEQARYTTTLSTLHPSTYPVHVVMEKGTGRVYIVGNKVVQGRIKSCEPQPFPTLSTDEALRTARTYLRRLNLELPSDAHLHRITYSQHRAYWCVVWSKREKGYEYFDPQGGEDSESIGVSFHEEYGFERYWYGMYLPSPTNLTVKIDAEEAARMAAPYAPKILKVPFYRAWHPGAFKIAGVKSAKLKIVAPNWLADPSRAIVLRDYKSPDGLPKYTRLAWVVTFETADADIKENRGGEIYVYVDAATGEILGGSFT